MKRLQFLFWVLLLFDSAKGQSSFNKVNQLDALLTKKATQQKINGMFLIQQDGRTLFQKSYGYSDWKSQSIITSQTTFKIGSLTKQFVAALILKLEEEGKLSTQSTLADFFPDYPRGAEITIDHLVRHTSGIPNFIFFPDYEQFMNRSHSQQEMIDRFKNLPLEFKSGAQYNYSNSGYYLLGVIVEKVTGKTFSESLYEKITKPLGLSNTGMWSTNELGTKGYQHLGEHPSLAKSIDPSVPFTAGGMYSSIDDLLKWQNNLFGSFLKPISKSKLLTPGLGNYGYGIWIDKAVQKKRIWHTGGINGFRCFMSWYPEDKINIIYLGNLEGVDTELLEEHIHEIILK